MLILILILCTFAALWTLKNMNNEKTWFFKHDDFSAALLLLCSCIAIGALLFSVYAIYRVIDGMSVDNQLVVYEEENTNIEGSINEMVLNYMDHEAKVFDNAKGDLDPTLIFTLYPDLKSNELVKSQIDVYVANNQSIKELRIKQAKLKTWRFLLYFGS